MGQLIKRRNLLFLFALTAVLVSCHKEQFAEMTFDNQIHDFGKIFQGDKVTHDFKFTNTSTADLVITDARGSCGCTVPKYPKEPIKPGKSGVIKVSFNSAGKLGETSKTVTIMCNVKEGSKVLYIKSIIDVPAKD